MRLKKDRYILKYNKGYVTVLEDNKIIFKDYKANLHKKDLEKVLNDIIKDLKCL